MSATCDERTVFWPGEEDFDAKCSLPDGHVGHHSGDGFCWTVDDEWVQHCDEGHV